MSDLTFTWELEEPLSPLRLEPRPRGEWILSWLKTQKRYYLSEPEARRLVKDLAETLEPQEKPELAPGIYYKIGGRFTCFRLNAEEFILSLIKPDRAVLVSLKTGQPWWYPAAVKAVKKGKEKYIVHKDFIKVANTRQNDFSPGPGASIKEPGEGR